MPRVTCGQCSRELEYAGGDRPLFCAFCGKSLASSTLTPPDPAGETVAGWHRTDASSRPDRAAETTPGWSGPATVEGPTASSIRGEHTVDYVAGTGRGARDEVPDRVKGYRIVRQLGKGGMGTVYEAEDSRHGRKVALKIIAPGYVSSAGAIDRFRQEGRLASSLAHPRCVFVLEADEDDHGRPFIVMELMTGATLQDLVEKGGALPIEDAVARILDVVEGLREAHRLGLIHRDVKPSNCFLDGDGRVKVGDFGLSKSQVDSSVHLTRTGAFLGTPLYASPEQIKAEVLDERTDVYSTAASLYFLLTGRAPFDRGDASATMARIVTEPAPSARLARPEVPSGLDRALRKGLERDRDRRFRDLDEFREALRPFAPGHIPEAKLSLRVGAYLADYFAITGASAALFLLHPGAWARIAASFGLSLVYYAVGDGVFGGSPGKRLLRMRVTDSEGREPLGLARATWRAAVFLALARLPMLLLALPGANWGGRAGAFRVACLAAEGLGVALLAAPMRGAGGPRGLHDLLSGARVVGLPVGDRRRAAGARRAMGRDRGSVSRPVGVMQAVGPYKVRGAVRWEPDRRVVAGEDPTLGREAWIVIQPRGSAPPGAARREITRATRPRWLGGGEQQEGRWDAYVAPAGCPIADLAGPEGLPWPEARPILEDLADELAAACAEGTLPAGLTVDLVWVQPDGRAILVDPLAIAQPSADSPGMADDERALGLLRRVAAVALEGGRRRTVDDSRTIASPVPMHASATLGRLLGGDGAHATVAAFRDDLEATRPLPAEVALGQRATSLGILGLLVFLGLIAAYALAYLILAGRGPGGTGAIARPGAVAERWTLAAIGFSILPIAWMAWDFATRGGFALRLAGLGLVLRDGRPAPRWRCAWRSLLVWVPPMALLAASVAAREAMPTPAWAGWLVFGLAVAWLPLGAASALLDPACGPHGRLSGLRVVPR